MGSCLSSILDIKVLANMSNKFDPKFCMGQKNLRVENPPTTPAILEQKLPIKMLFKNYKINLRFFNFKDFGILRPYIGGKRRI